MPSLVAGLAILLLGVLLMLDGLDALDMSFALFGPVACAVMGAILLASGLSRRE